MFQKPTYAEGIDPRLWPLSAVLSIIARGEGPVMNPRLRDTFARLRKRAAEWRDELVRVPTRDTTTKPLPLASLLGFRPEAEVIRDEEAVCLQIIHSCERMEAAPIAEMQGQATRELGYLRHASHLMRPTWARR